MPIADAAARADSASRSQGRTRGEREWEVGGAVIGNTAIPSTLPNAARSQWQYCHDAPEASHSRSRERTQDRRSLRSVIVTDQNGT